MKCHYEILNIPREAEESEIKTAYKKLALKWHPDKNLNNPDEAKEYFQLVQQAYEVLIDRQERAWYDNHREQILRGSNKDYEDNSLDVFQYFTSSCFKGYGDDDNGFYAVYRKVFEQLAKEDCEHMEAKEEFTEIPMFGSLSSDYETIVGPFYNYWMSYSTKKSYVWLDPYNINETRERRVLKIVEKENKKVRAKAKKERNEEVRNLVAFVRKRDKRVQAYSKIQEARTKENRQKQEELSKMRRLERRKAMHESPQQAEWAKFDNVQSELKEIEKNLAAQFGEELSNSELEESDVEDDNNLYCVACNKIFKTPKAFQNHESSKKHRENVELLKETLIEEDEEYLENNDSDLDASQESVEDFDGCENVEMSEIDLDEEIKLEKTKSKKKNRKSKNVLKIESEDEAVINFDNSAEDVAYNTSKASKKKQRKSKRENREGKLEISEKSTKNENPEDAKNFENENCDNDKLIPEDFKLNPEVNPDTAESNSINICPNTNLSEEKSSKKNKKKSKSRTNEKTVEEIDKDHCCVSCRANFDSKNKLFEHLKKTGHSVLLPKAPKDVRKHKKILREK